MIKKLRRRFILIMMLLVAVVLLITFSFLVISSAQRLADGSYRSLEDGYIHTTTNESLAEGSSSSQSFDGQAPSSAFYVAIDSNGSITQLGDTSGVIPDETAQAAVSAALAKHSPQGVLSTYSLRYMFLESTTYETVIGFIDIRFEHRYIRGQIFSFSLIGLGSLAAFFAVSLILSGVAISPVEKAWKNQQQFIADASHELKTPITIMLANTSILLSDKSSNERQSKKWLTHIDQEAKHMQKLVEDLLFLAQADSKNSETQLCRIDLSDTVLQSVLPFEPVLFESGKELSTDITHGLFIIGHPGQIKQLTSILLDNSQKYAYSNTRITLRLYKENNRAMLIINTFADTIDKKDLPRIFDRFYKTDKARTRGANSYGLGLAIAKEIVTIHKGKISASSDEQNGTTFTVTLPLA